MKLVGNFAEAKELTGEENLATIVKKGIYQKAILSEDFIPEINNSSIEEYGNRKQKTFQALRNILNEVPLPSQESAFQDAKNSLVREYVCSTFDMHYDLLNDGLFEIKRQIYYEGDECKEDIEESFEGIIEIPLFASALQNNSIWEFDIVRETGNKGYNRKKHEIKITSEMPPITRDAKEKLKEARALYMSTLSEALKEPIVGDLVLSNLESEKGSNVGGADLYSKVYWIPRPSDLEIKTNVVDLDPFIAANIYGKNYLVAQWDTKDEIPFRHYIEEFKER